MARKKDNIYKRKDGRWEGRFIVIDEQGTKKYKSVYAKTKKELKEKLEDKKEKMQEGIELAVMAEKWLDYKKNDIKKILYDTYKVKIEKIIQYFKNYKACDINEDVIKKYHEHLRQSGLSQRTINNKLTILKAILSFDENYKRDEIKNKDNLTNTCSKMKILTKEEFAMLIKYCSVEITPYKVSILLIIYTGLRLSELCALKWNDINLEQGTISISKTTQRIHDSSKDNSTMLITDIDERTVYIPSEAVKILKKVSHKENAYVNSKQNSPMDHRTMQKALQSYLDKLESVPKVTFSDLRDNFAVHSLESGVDVRIIAQNMGVKFQALEKYFAEVNQVQDKRKEIDKFYLI